MKILLSILFLLFLFTGVRAKDSLLTPVVNDTIQKDEQSEPDFQSILERDEKARVRGIDFRAFGNEPFWILEIDAEGNTIFSLHDRLDVVFATPAPETYTEKKTIIYKSPEGNIDISLIQENCPDNMSGEKMTFTVSVNFKNTEFKGCGKFLVFNKNPLLKSDIGRLNDIWALEKYMDDPVDSLIKARGLPLLEIHLNEGRIMGNNGCNEYSGAVDVDDTVIKFDRIISTKMFCPGSMELQYMDALRKVNKWEISGMRLFLIINGKNYLTFRKID
ncbi:MAG: META domain-containing protein [Ignavibacteria bacterium]|nr:META domain-containing protein [Ignavibacteria bacterium]